MIIFDYFGFVFGRGVDVIVVLILGRIENVSVIVGGLGYVFRLNVRVDFIFGFDV